MVSRLNSGEFSDFPADRNTRGRVISDWNAYRVSSSEASSARDFLAEGVAEFVEVGGCVVEVAGDTDVHAVSPFDDWDFDAVLFGQDLLQRMRFAGPGGGHDHVFG